MPASRLWQGRNQVRHRHRTKHAYTVPPAGKATRCSVHLRGPNSLLSCEVSIETGLSLPWLVLLVAERPESDARVSPETMLRVWAVRHAMSHADNAPSPRYVSASTSPVSMDWSARLLASSSTLSSLYSRCLPGDCAQDAARQQVKLGACYGTAARAVWALASASRCRQPAAIKSVRTFC
jgi:hypothetical protein